MTKQAAIQRRAPDHARPQEGADADRPLLLNKTRTAGSSSGRTARRTVLLSNSAATTSTLLLLVVVVVVLPVAEATFSMTVESGTEECFVIRASGEKGRLSTINGNYDCLDDGINPEPVAVTLYDPRMRPVWKSRPNASEGRFSIVGQGRYQLCIGNGVNPKRPDGQDRTVGFAVRVRDLQRERERKMEEAKAAAEEAKEEAEGGDGKSKSVKKAAETASLTEQLVERLQTLKDHQSFLREREAVHRDVAEGTFGHLIKWTLAEACCLVVVALGQVYYLRKFFETKTYL